MNSETKEYRYTLLKIHTRLLFCAMFLKVVNMSSPLIRENRHSDTVFKDRN